MNKICCFFRVLANVGIPFLGKNLYTPLVMSKVSGSANRFSSAPRLPSQLKKIKNHVQIQASRSVFAEFGRFRFYQTPANNAIQLKIDRVFNKIEKILSSQFLTCPSIAQLVCDELKMLKPRERTLVLDQLMGHSKNFSNLAQIVLTKEGGFLLELFKDKIFFQSDVEMSCIAVKEFFCEPRGDIAGHHLVDLIFRFTPPYRDGFELFNSVDQLTVYRDVLTQKLVKDGWMDRLFNSSIMTVRRDIHSPLKMILSNLIRIPEGRSFLKKFVANIAASPSSFSLIILKELQSLLASAGHRMNVRLIFDEAFVAELKKIALNHQEVQTHLLIELLSSIGFQPVLNVRCSSAMISMFLGIADALKETVTGKKILWYFHYFEKDPKILLEAFSSLTLKDVEEMLPLSDRFGGKRFSEFLITCFSLSKVNPEQTLILEAIDRAKHR